MTARRARIAPLLPVVVGACLYAPIALAPACSSSDAGSAAPANALLPGESCDPTSKAPIALHFDPPSVVLAPGHSRVVTVIAEPDVCTPAQATFATSDANVTAAPAPAPFDAHHASYTVTVRAGAIGSATVTATLARAFDHATGTGTLAVDVIAPDVVTCNAGDAAATTAMDASHTTANGTAALANASFAIPQAAFTRNDELAIAPFAASIACAGDLTKAAPGAPIALGPAVTFAGIANPGHVLRREVTLTLPINPAAMPDSARLRHLQILYQGPTAKTPRRVTIASPRLEKVGGGYVVHFATPWLGTYQAAIAPDAGAVTRTRTLTHRAVVGISMGAGGSASFGLRHHDKFDAIVPLGGPTDWTWLLYFIEHYATAGFCPASNPMCPTYAPNLYPFDEPFAHSMDYDHWWNQPGKGTGGGFPRSTYVQLLTDLTLMRGNPNGENDALSLFAAGPKPGDPWVTGDTTGLPPGTDCSFGVEPPSDATDPATLSKIIAQCNKSRCDPKNAYVAPSGYFDDEFNPDGSRQVISVCDGAQTGDSPYENTWAQPSADEAIPVNFALAVDLNKNGVRDMGEPILRSGHEPYTDTGTDGKADADEPGYDAMANPDPAGDDYDPQVNPTGTENDHHWEAGEPFLDVGLDGVPGTASRHVAGDPGEGDGAYTEATGLKAWYPIDPHSMLRGWVTDLPGGALDDDALARLSILTDGGVRDVFNFESAARHLVGAIASRTRQDGAPVLATTFYDGFDALPGEPLGDPTHFAAERILWADVPGAPSIRYGDPDATADMIDQGDGEHVGTGSQIVDRIETALYFSAAQWPDANRMGTEETSEDPETTTQNELGTTCELIGRCEKSFTGPKTGRTGPVIVHLPPGYAAEANRVRGLRYPVIFLLHGYGQEPQDLEVLTVLTGGSMNDVKHSSATRLAQAITVFVDGRCRVGKDGKPECIQGGFYLDSTRPGGPQFDSWFDEVVDYVDANYRTLAPSTVTIAE